MIRIFLYVNSIFLAVLILCSYQKLHSKEAVAKAPTVTLAFVGDVILHERLRTREEKTKEGYSPIWSGIQGYLASADLTYANLEGPVAPELGVTGYPMFNYPEKIIPALKISGFDVVSTANNHALDRAAIGIQMTIANLKKYDLAFTGTVENKNAPWVALSEIKKLGVVSEEKYEKKYMAWLACTEMTNGNRDRLKQVLYCYKNRNLIKDTVSELSKRTDVMAVVLTPHWGEEDTFVVERNRQQWAHEMLNAGATAIVGAHPHVIQKEEEFKTDDERSTAVLYSLGNFVSNQKAVKNKLSMIYYLKLSPGSGGKLALQESRALPLWMSRTIQKDGTSVYRLSAIWDFSKLPAEVEKIWASNMGKKTTFKTENELQAFLD